MRLTKTSKIDIEALAGLASAILGMLGAQVIMLGIIALSLGASADQIFAGMILIAGLLMNVASVLVWTGAQKIADAVVVAADRVGVISKG